MQVGREVRVPTVSNSILQTVRKHAAAVRALGSCVQNVRFYAYIFRSFVVVVFKSVS